MEQVLVDVQHGCESRWLVKVKVHSMVNLCPPVMLRSTYALSGRGRFLLIFVPNF